jgi:hypothetical protein
LGRNVTRTTRTVAASAICGCVLASCGGASKTTTSTPTPSTSTAAAKAQAIALQAQKCYAIIGAEAKVGQDAGHLAQNAANTAFDNQAVADIDALKTAVQQIEPAATSTQLPILQQYTTVLDRLDQAIQSQAGGNLVAAGGQLTGVALEYKQLNPQIVPICTSEAGGASSSPSSPSTTASAPTTSPPSGSDLASLNQDFLTIVGHCLKVIGGTPDPGISAAVSDYIAKFQRYGTTPFQLAAGGPTRNMALLLKSAVGVLQSCDPTDVASLNQALASAP